MKPCLQHIYDFYKDGFLSMRLGKLLWLIILVKLFIIFFILKLFFFPDFLGKYKTPAEKREYVSGELVNRANYFTNYFTK